MKSLFRRVLSYFLLRKDFIVLNPDWSPISKTEGMAVVGRKSNHGNRTLISEWSNDCSRRLGGYPTFG
jgi:hypothetical protein